MGGKRKNITFVIITYAGEDVKQKYYGKGARGNGDTEILYNQGGCGDDEASRKHGAEADLFAAAESGFIRNGLQDKRGGY